MISPDKLRELADIPIPLTLVLGRRPVPLSEIRRWRVGSTVRLPLAAGSNLEVVAEGVRLASARIMVVGGRTCAQVTEIEDGE